MTVSVADVLARTAPSHLSPLPAPAYVRPDRKDKRVALAVESMKRHMTNEGWQIMDGLSKCSLPYALAGSRLPLQMTDVGAIVDYIKPTVLLLQDKREWDNRIRSFRDPKETFSNVRSLKQYDDIFKLTILKDSHQRPSYHAASADEIGAHAWVTYYHPRIVKHLSGFVRPEHCVRTYHTLDADEVPFFSKNRGGTLLSGAVSSAYPLRDRLVKGLLSMPRVTYLRHPGYHNKGSHTNDYLRTLSQYKVAICTASRFGYVLRKMLEATACGCVVVTDLPIDEVVPEIDANLVRVGSDISPKEMQELCEQLESTYDAERQQHFATLAKQRYDYRYETNRLAHAIESLREDYA